MVFQLSSLSDRKPLFTTRILVLVNHLNYGNHLGYDSMLSIIQEARIRFLKYINATEMSIDGYIGYLVTDIAVSYKSESFHGDELEVQIYIHKIRAGFMGLHYVVTKIDNKIVALCETKHVFYNYKTKKLDTITAQTVDLICNFKLGK